MNIGFFIEAMYMGRRMGLKMLGSVKILRSIQRIIRTIYKRERAIGARITGARVTWFFKGCPTNIYTYKNLENHIY